MTDVRTFDELLPGDLLIGMEELRVLMVIAVKRTPAGFAVLWSDDLSQFYTYTCGLALNMGTDPYWMVLR